MASCNEPFVPEIWSKNPLGIPACLIDSVLEAKKTYGHAAVGYTTYEDIPDSAFEAIQTVFEAVQIAFEKKRCELEHIDIPQDEKDRQMYEASHQAFLRAMEVNDGMA